MIHIPKGKLNNVQNRRSLLFTGEGIVGDEIAFTVPPSIDFESRLMFSMWYKIDNANPPTGDTEIALVQSLTEKVTFGFTYSGGDEATFYARIGDTQAFEFQSEVIFDADTDNDWMHYFGLFDWATPSNSVLWKDNLPVTLTTLSPVNTTQFTPISGTSNLDHVVSGIEIAELYVAKAPASLSTVDFERGVAKRFSNGKLPLSLGKRGETPQHAYAWVYTSFYDKDDGNGGLANDANQSALEFGTFTNYEINLDAVVELPPPIAVLKKREELRKRVEARKAMRRKS